MKFFFWSQKYFEYFFIKSWCIYWPKNNPYSALKRNHSNIWRVLSSACFKRPSHSLSLISRVFALHTKSLNSHFPDQNHRQELCSRPFLSISLALLFSLSHQTLVFSFERSALSKTPQQRTSRTTEKLLRGAWAWPVSNPTTESVYLLLISPFVALMLYFPICWIQIRFFYLQLWEFPGDRTALHCACWHQVGKKMGWLELMIDRVGLMGFWVLLLIMVCGQRAEKRRSGSVIGSLKWVLAIFLCLLAFGYGAAACLFQWVFLDL